MKVYTTEEVADILKYDIETIRRYIQNNQLKAYKIGKSWRVEEKDLKQFIRRSSNYTDK